MRCWSQTRLRLGQIVPPDSTDPLCTRTSSSKGRCPADMGCFGATDLRPAPELGESSGKTLVSPRLHPAHV